MAINDNLHFTKVFIKPMVRFCTEAFQKTWSAEKQIHYTSRIEKITDFGLNRDIIITVKPSFVRNFSATEKCFIYEILRLTSIEFPKIRYILDDLQQLLRRRGYQNERYFYLSSLTDNQFAYDIDVKLTPGNPNRRRYYRLFSSYFGRERLTLEQVFDKYFFTDIVELNRPKAKNKVRHKGYRDHGSLGSEFSKTLKQQSNDWSLRKTEEEREKLKNDYLRFLAGFAGNDID
jgi:hypothetical protein